MKWTATLVLFLLLLANPGIGTAQDSWGVDCVGYLPGTIEDTHIQGDYAYCATQCGLLVLDVAAVTNPVQVAFLPLYHENHILLSLYRGISVDGDFAYLVGPWGPMQIVDISDPAVPVRVGICDAPEYAYDVVAGDGYAYITDEYDGLRIIDVSDPTAAHQVGFVALPDRPRGLALDGTTVYVVANTAGLRIIDASVPTAPVEIGVCDVGGNNRGVDVAGDLAYVTGGGGTSIIDVSVPSAPIEVGFFKVINPLHSVTAHAEYIYATCGYGGLFILQHDPVSGVDTGESMPVPPRRHALRQNHPNPFNPSTVIRFELPEPTAVSLRVYDLTGHLVRVLLGGEAVTAGRHEAVWSGRDDAGRAVAAGVYFCRLETATYRETRRMTLVK